MHCLHPKAVLIVPIPMSRTSPIWLWTLRLPCVSDSASTRLREPRSRRQSMPEKLVVKFKQMVPIGTESFRGISNLVEGHQMLDPYH